MTVAQHECDRQTHGHTAVNTIYGHMGAKTQTQTYMDGIVRMSVTDMQVYWHTDTERRQKDCAGQGVTDRLTDM